MKLYPLLEDTNEAKLKALHLQQLAVDRYDLEYDLDYVEGDPRDNPKVKAFKLTLAPEQVKTITQGTTKRYKDTGYVPHSILDLAASITISEFGTVVAYDVTQDRIGTWSVNQLEALMETKMAPFSMYLS